MSLKSKAKTSGDIFGDYSLKSYPENKAEFVKFAYQKWVPLEDAQELEAESEKWQADWQNLNDERQRLADKITDARTILEADANHLKDVLNYKPEQTYPAENVLRLVEEVLTSLSSNNTNGEKTHE